MGAQAAGPTGGTVSLLPCANVIMPLIAALKRWCPWWLPLQGERAEGEADEALDSRPWFQ